MDESVRLRGWKDGGVASAMSRSRAHLLIAHVPVGPFSITHHFPHHYPKAPDITGCCMLSMCNDLWGCPAKQTTWALRVGFLVIIRVVATFIEQRLYAQMCVQAFISSILFDPHNNPVG